MWHFSCNQLLKVREGLTNVVIKQKTNYITSIHKRVYISTPFLYIFAFDLLPDLFCFRFTTSVTVGFLGIVVSLVSKFTGTRPSELRGNIELEN